MKKMERGITPCSSGIQADTSGIQEIIPGSLEEVLVNLQIWFRDLKKRVA